MRKMTKTAVTLAAMSAMTVATASMAFAAEKQEPNISSIAREEEAVNTSAVGEWSGNDVDGWKFTKEDGTKLKDQWAQIDGVWYYFKGDKIAQDRFLTLDDKGYFFDNTGRLATGWQKITSKMDAYSDIDIADELYNSYNNYYVHVNDTREYDYHDYVWCYFDQNGIAKHNEWFQDGTGLWYYFDGDVMVKNVYNYVVNPDNYDAADSNKLKIYGFDEEGAMLTYWNYKEVETTWNDPTADEEGKIWYYYGSNGQMQKEGWRQIDGKWYLFANRDADENWIDKVTNGVGSRDDDNWSIGGYPLIVNSYVASYNQRRDGKYEYFYVNAKGEMVTGVHEVPKNAYKILFYTDTNDKHPDVAYEVVQTDTAITVNFGSNGAATEALKDGKYYVMDVNNTVSANFDSSASQYVWKVNNSLYNASYVFSDTLKVTNGTWNFTDSGFGAPSISIPSSELTDDDVIAYAYWYDFLLKESNKIIDGEPIALSDDDKIYIPKTDANEKLIAEARILIDAINDDTTGLMDKAEKAKEVYESSIKGTSEAPYAVEYPGTVEGYENVLWTLVDPVTGSQAVTGHPQARAEALQEIRNIIKEIENKEKDVAIAENAYNIWVTYGNDNKDISKTQEYKDELDARKEKIKEEKEIVTALKNVEKYVVNYLETYYGEEATKNSAAYDKAKKDLRDALEKLRRKEYEISLVATYTKDSDGNYIVISDREIAEITNDFTVKGELVKNAFIGKNDVYLADDKGELLKNKAVVISTKAGIVLDGTKYDNAYILFGNDAKGVNGYDGTRKSITIGGVTYWATDITTKVGKKDLTVFVSNKSVDATNDGVKNPQR